MLYPGSFQHWGKDWNGGMIADGRAPQLLTFTEIALECLRGPGGPTGYSSDLDNVLVLGCLPALSHPLYPHSCFEHHLLDTQALVSVSLLLLFLLIFRGYLYILDMTSLSVILLQLYSPTLWSYSLFSPTIFFFFNSFCGCAGSWLLHGLFSSCGQWGAL